MQQYCGCYSLLLHYMPKNVLFVTYSRSISQPHTRLTEMTLGRQVDIAVLQFTASYEADRLSFRCWLSYYSFNSQPHTRLTLPASPSIWYSKAFQFTASYEADQELQWQEERIRNFQFTASYGADQFFQSYFLLFLYPFNSQPHTRLTLHRRNNIVLFAIFQFTVSYEADHFTLYVL